MKKLVFIFMLAAVLGVRVSFAQESQPTRKQPSSFAGTDSPEALREHVPVRGRHRFRCAGQLWQTHSRSRRKSHEQADQDAGLFPHPQGSHWRLSSV